MNNKVVLGCGVASVLAMLLVAVVVWVAVLNVSSTAPALVDNSSQRAPETQDSTNDDSGQAKARAAMEEDAAEQARFQEGIQGDRQRAEEASTPPPPRDFRVGDTVTFPSGDSVTLYSYTSPVQSDNRFLGPRPGTQLATVDVEGCASSNSAYNQVALNPYFFSLQMPDNTRIGTTIPVVNPALGHTNLSPGECVRGTVSFQVPQRVTPGYVRLERMGPQETTKWAVQ